MTERTPDEVADSFRADFADAHALLDAYDGPNKARVQVLVGGAHALMERAAKLLNDETGSGAIQARAGDDKD